MKNTSTFKILFLSFFFSFLRGLGGLSAWEGKLDEVEDTDVVEVKQCARDNFVFSSEG